MNHNVLCESFRSCVNLFPSEVLVEASATTYCTMSPGYIIPVYYTRTQSTHTPGQTTNFLGGGPSFDFAIRKRQTRHRYKSPTMGS